MKDYIQGTGYTQLVTSSDCIGSFSATIFFILTAIPVSWGGSTTPANVPDAITLQDDLINTVHLLMNDLPQYQYYAPGCDTPPVTPVPKPMPTIDGPFYFIVGYDTGIKSFSLTSNP